jgi:hypothetical protein
MILVGKRTIIEEIEDAVRGFSVTEQCPLDFVILSDDEWEELRKLMKLEFNDTEISLNGVSVVRNGHIPNMKEPKHYVKGDFR